MWLFTPQQKKKQKVENVNEVLCTTLKPSTLDVLMHRLKMQLSTPSLRRAQRILFEEDDDN